MVSGVDLFRVVMVFMIVLISFNGVFSEVVFVVSGNVFGRLF